MLDFFKWKKSPQKETILAPKADLESAPISPLLSAESNDEPESSAKEKADENTPNQLGLLARLKAGLSRTRQSLASGITQLFAGKHEIDAEVLEELENILLTSDVGIQATEEIITDLKKRVKQEKIKHPDELIKALQDDLTKILEPSEVLLEITHHKPFVILVVGVNGAGKTTTIGKLAKKFQAEGKSVLLAAGDTFRAAAVEQLKVWGERNEISVIAQQSGADSASVIFDAFEAAKAKHIDILIADTAGRLHTQGHLMDELKKVVRVLKKIDDKAPHEVLLVLDASIGQNALSQAVQFDKAVAVSGLVVTKLDGTARGGIMFNIAKTLTCPIRFIGIGEGIEDLRSFSARPFVEALFSDVSKLEG